MEMEGDGLKGQPSDGADTLTALADSAWDEGEEADDIDDGGEEPEIEGEEAPEGEEEEGEEEEEDDPTVVIKHDGKDVELKLSEVKNLAQQGFDYSKKTMAVAEERKAAEAERAKAAEYRQNHEQALTETIGRLQAFAQFMEEQVGSPPPIEWAQQDAAYYLAQKELYENRKGQLQQAHAAIQNLTQEQSRQRQDWIARQADETERALKDTLPGWSDETMDALAGYLGNFGLTPKTVDVAFVQKGLWELAHKAKAYDDLLAKKATLKPKAELQRVQKPSASNQPNRAGVQKAKAFERLKRNPSSVDALADLIG